jgi:hypothetical protein
LLGGSIIGAGANLISGFFQRSAAKKAAEIQARAAEAAGHHLEDTITSVNPQITGAAQRAGDRQVDTAWNAIEGVNQATREANARLDPYAASGRDANAVLQAGIAPGGDFNKTPTLSDLQMDPGYAFRTSEGEKAIARSAAAHGGATGGGVLKDLTNYSQGAASQEFQNAFARFQQSTQNRFGNVNTVAGRGFNAANTQGGNDIGASQFGAGLATDASKYAGNADINAAQVTGENTIGGARTAGQYITGAGEARAAGEVGGQNAITGAVGGAVSGITGALTLKRLLQNPALYNKFRIGPVGPEGSAWGGG